MTIFHRLNRWQEQARITPEQYRTLTALAHKSPFSVYLELNVLLYVGVVAIVGGLGWTIQTYAHQLGNAAILLGLTTLLVGCLFYCFTQTPNLLFDYVLYLGCLSWSLELGYIEKQFHVLNAQWDLYLFITSLLYFALAYRFDNRFVLSMAITALGSWFGVKVMHVFLSQPEAYRSSAILYGVVLLSAGLGFDVAGIKKHFTGTYLNFAANVIFVAVLSGVWLSGVLSMWTVGLLLAMGCSLFYGLKTQQFAFVAYAAVYGYLGVSSLFVRHIDNYSIVLVYFLCSGIGMMIFLTWLARNFGKES